MVLQPGLVAYLSQLHISDIKNQPYFDQFNTPVTTLELK